MSNGMEIAERRENLCRAIASMPERACMQIVSELLDPLTLDSSSGTNRSENSVKDLTRKVSERNLNESDAGLTPIMTACDMDQPSCLAYIDRKLNDQDVNPEVFGHPFDASPESSGSNSAIHFAAMSGFGNSIDILCSIAQKMDSRSSVVSGKSNPAETSSSNPENFCLCFLTQRNNHGDTPLMIASASGHEKCLKHWIGRLVDSLQGKCDGQTLLSKVRELLQCQNQSGDSVLSLACGHGHVAIVDLLIHDRGFFSVKDTTASIVEVSYNDVDKCKATLKRIEDAFKNVAWDTVSKAQRDEYQTRKDNVHRCLVMLQVCLTRQAERNMESLIQAEESNRDALSGPHSQKGRRKKKQTKVSKGTKLQSQTSDLSECVEIASTENLRKDEDNAWGCENVKHSKNETTVGVILGGKRMDISGFKTLHDGTVVSPGRQQDSDAWHHCDAALNTKVAGQPSDSVEEMLRARYRGEDTNDCTIDAFMESLCLDASMLLLSPHGMAMKLSPSQLDAVSGILDKQVKAVEEARRIQSRFRAS